MVTVSTMLLIGSWDGLHRPRNGPLPGLPGSFSFARPAPGGGSGDRNLGILHANGGLAYQPRAPALGPEFGHSPYPEWRKHTAERWGMPPRPRAEGAEHTSPGQSREAGAALGGWREIFGRPARAAANGCSSGRCHSRWRQKAALPRMARGVLAAPLQGAGVLEDITQGVPWAGMNDAVGVSKRPAVPAGCCLLGNCAVRQEGELM